MTETARLSKDNVYYSEIVVAHDSRDKRLDNTQCINSSFITDISKYYFRLSSFLRALAYRALPAKS